MGDRHLCRVNRREPLLPWYVERGLAKVELSNFTSALISFFIWKTHRDVRQTTASSLQVFLFLWSWESSANLIYSQSVLRIFIESAGMWVLCIIVTFVVYMINVIAAYVPLYLVCPCFIPKKPLSTHHFHGADQPRPWSLLLHDGHPSSTPQQYHHRGIWKLQTTVQLQDCFKGAQLIHCRLHGRTERAHGLQFKTN